MTAGVHHAGIAGGKAFARWQMIGGAAFVLIERIHIHAETHHRAGTTGFQRGDHATKSAGEVFNPLRQRALFQRARFLLRQHFIRGQSHARVGIDHLAAQLELITKTMQLFSHQRGGAELQPARFGKVV